VRLVARFDGGLDGDDRDACDRAGLESRRGAADIATALAIDQRSQLSHRAITVVPTVRFLLSCTRELGAVSKGFWSISSAI